MPAKLKESLEEQSVMLLPQLLTVDVSQYVERASREY